jgi:hypothetical protein
MRIRRISTPEFPKKQPAGKPKKYDFDSMEVGDTLEVPVNKGEDVRTIRNSIGCACRQWRTRRKLPFNFGMWAVAPDDDFWGDGVEVVVRLTRLEDFKPGEGF